MKIMIVADKESEYIWDYFNPERFKDVDLIISCGDLKASYLSFLVTMINVPLLYVHGNHNTSYLKNAPEGCENIDGRLVTFNNIKILGLGGSQKYNNGYFQYTDNQMVRRINKLTPSLWWNGGFDILVSHSPAYGLGDGNDFCHRGFRAFNYLLDKYSPKYHFHGHQHLSYARNSRIINYNSTTIINGYEYVIIEY